MSQKKFLILTLVFAIAACGPPPTPVIPATTPTPRPRATSTEIPTPAPTPDSRIQIRLWHSLPGSQRDALNALVVKFNTSRNDTQLTAIYIGTDIDLIRTLNAALNRDDAPDLVLAYPTDLAPLNKSGALAPLDDPRQFFSADDLRDIFPAFIDHYPQFSNRVYSVGFARHLQVMYYNSDLLKSVSITKPPESWDDLSKACAATSKAPDALCFELDPNALDFESAVLSRGGGLTSGDGKRVVFDQKPGLDALSFIADAFKNKSALITTRAFQEQSDFAAGRVAFTLDTTLALAAYETQIKNAGKKFGWGIAVPPRTVTPIVMAYGPSLAILKHAPEKQLAAFTFVKWMLDKDANSDWVIATNAFPARAATKDSLAEYIKMNPRYDQAFAWLRFARAEPSIAEWASVRGFIAEALLAAAGGKIAPADALRDAASKANTALGQ